MKPPGTKKSYLRDLFYDKHGKLSMTAMVTPLFVLMAIDLYLRAVIFGQEVPIQSWKYVSVILEIIVGLGAAKVGASYLGHSLSWSRAKNTMLASTDQNAGMVQQGKNDGTPAPLKINVLYQAIAEYLGLREIKGPRHNPTIMEWIKEMGWTRIYPSFDSDDDPWCSLPVNVHAKRLGFEYSNSPRAKSNLEIGQAITVEEIREGSRLGPEYAILAIWHRPSAGPQAGHVGALKELKGPNQFVTIDGNKSDMIKEVINDLDDPNFIGFRLLRKIA